MAEGNQTAGTHEESKDPVLIHLEELWKYVEFSHDGLSKRLDSTQAEVSGIRADVTTLRADVTALRTDVTATRDGLGRLDRKVDSGFDRLARKIDGLGSARRASPRRRKP